MTLAAVQTNAPTTRRRNMRSNTFLMAMLVTDTLSAPVRIKNLSASGALLSGRDLPRRGERCRLRRGEAAVSAIVVREVPHGAAIRFERLIDEVQWIGAANQMQRDVDRVVHDATHRYPVADSNHRLTAVQAAPAVLAPSPVSRDELMDLADQLDRLANAFSDDEHVITRYLDRLQLLDIASQRLRSLR